MAKAIRRVTLAVIAGCALTSAALAGSGNSLYLVQENTYPGLTGNTISVDQHLGEYTSVGNSLQPATQSGSGNAAQLTLTGNCTIGALDCGTVALDQDNSSDGLSLAIPAMAVPATPQGNFASISVSGTGNASVTQIGDQNQAYLGLDDGHGTITQQGLDNLAKLAITGDLTGTIAQTGNHNIGNLSIAGTPGATVSLTQTGDNQSYVGGSGDNSGEPMTVFTTTSGVSITQTSF